MEVSNRKIKLMLLIHLLIFLSLISISATEWRGREYKSYYYPPTDDVIDDVKQKIMEKYNLSEEYFDEHLIISSADVYCHDPTEEDWNYSTFCWSKKENPHLLQSAQVGWIFVPDREEYKNTSFFTNAQFFVGVEIYDEEGLDKAIEDMERNTGFMEVNVIIIDETNNAVYSFTRLQSNVLEVIKPGDLLISKEEAEEKLLQCVKSFSSQPYVGVKGGIVYMAANGPPNFKGEQKYAKVDLETGEVVQCVTRGPPELLDSEDDRRILDDLDNQPSSKENVIKNFFNWLSKLFKRN